jgi:hypothetical protein
MTGYTRWRDVRAAHVERAGGEEAVEAGKRGLLATCDIPAPGPGRGLRHPEPRKPLSTCTGSTASAEAVARPRHRTAGDIAWSDFPTGGDSR